MSSTFAISQSKFCETKEKEGKQESLGEFSQPPTANMRDGVFLYIILGIFFAYSRISQQSEYPIQICSKLLQLLPALKMKNENENHEMFFCLSMLKS